MTSAALRLNREETLPVCEDCLPNLFRPAELKFLGKKTSCKELSSFCEEKETVAKLLKGSTLSKSWFLFRP